MSTHPRLKNIENLRQNLMVKGAAGIVLSTSKNVDYICGYQSVMDGWHLTEPLSSVFIPLDASRPVTLFLPEASVIGLVVAAREGSPIQFERLRTFDLLNFCITARGQDAHLELSETLVNDLDQYSKLIDGECAPDIIESIARCLLDEGLATKTVLFDDMRVALSMNSKIGQKYEDGLELIHKTRSIKTNEEIKLIRESGVKADKVMSHTVSKLKTGARWTDIEKSVAHFMIDENVDPLPTSPMLFGGSYDTIFRPDLFRTTFDTPFEKGQIVILETQGVYKNHWIDINRTAHIGPATSEYKAQHRLVQNCFTEASSHLRPGQNTTQICEEVLNGSARALDAPEKLLMVIHSIGRVPLESPSRYPATGIHGATEGFLIEESMVLSLDCLYFGSKLGPSHMENVFVIEKNSAVSIYQYPLELIETE